MARAAQRTRDHRLVALKLSRPTAGQRQPLRSSSRPDVAHRRRRSDRLRPVHQRSRRGPSRRHQRMCVHALGRRREDAHAYTGYLDVGKMCAVASTVDDDCAPTYYRPMGTCALRGSGVGTNASSPVRTRTPLACRRVRVCLTRRPSPDFLRSRRWLLWRVCMLLYEKGVGFDEKRCTISHVMCLLDVPSTNVQVKSSTTILSCHG